MQAQQVAQLITENWCKLEFVVTWWKCCIGLRNNRDVLQTCTDQHMQWRAWRNCQTCRRPTRVRTSTYSSSSVASWLRKGYTVQDGRAHVRGHSWNCAVIRESTGSCRRSTWSTFPPLCSDQSSAGAVRETVYRRRPDLPCRRTHHLQQPAGQCDFCSVSVDLPSASENISVSGLASGHYHRSPLNYSPTFSGSWSGFITWTILKIRGWLIGWLESIFLLDSDSADDGLVVLFTYDVVLCSRSVHHIGFQDRERKCAENYNKWHNKIIFKLQSAFCSFQTMTVSECCLIKVLPCILFEKKYLYFSIGNGQLR